MTIQTLTIPMRKTEIQLRIIQPDRVQKEPKTIKIKLSLFPNFSYTMLILTLKGNLLKNCPNCRKFPMLKSLKI